MYLFRWKIKTGKEEQFIKAWAYITVALRDHCGSLGSRLHKGNDGFYYGYAQWPSVEARAAAVWDNDEMNDSRRLMKDAIEESFPDVILNPLEDFLIHGK